MWRRFLLPRIVAKDSKSTNEGVGTAQTGIALNEAFVPARLLDALTGCSRCDIAQEEAVRSWQLGTGSMNLSRRD